MGGLLDYASELVKRAGRSLRSGEIFAKVLSANDDSGRHGVLIPTDAYSFFPPMEIANAQENATSEFAAFDAISGTSKTLAYKYYERYPERRITRLNVTINRTEASPRLIVFLRATHTDGTTGYYVDSADSGLGGRFSALFRTVIGEPQAGSAGSFVIRPVKTVSFTIDGPLAALLEKFDSVKRMGWVATKRIGDTGVGYTFETLIGIRENNDRVADFQGIEIKCKGIREGNRAGSGKLNLFQEAPVWLRNESAKNRIRLLGQLRPNGFYACRSQLTTRSNNLGLMLSIQNDDKKIDLLKTSVPVGFWSFAQLKRRLAEKHSRAVFIKAASRERKGIVHFKYEDLVYCDSPSIARFVNLVSQRRIVFEFLMSERSDGTIKNPGYPWRLCREEFLDQLFLLRVGLRSREGDED